MSLSTLTTGLPSPGSPSLTAAIRLPSLLALAVLLAAMLAAAPALLWAQEDGEKEDFYVETVSVNVVNVEVHVTDKKGNRITGLTRDDFVLTVDKQPTAITNFYAVEGGVPTRETLEALDLELPPEVEDKAREGLEVDDRPDEQKLHLIVYIDNFNLRPFDRNRVIRATRTFLRSHLRPGDEVMLVSYDRSLNIRHPFTKDSELVASALYELEDITGFKVHADNERQDLLDMIYNDARDIYDVRGRVTQHAESIYNDMSFTMDALRDQVETLAGLPGRKAILYVSGGLSMRPGEDLFYALNDKFQDSSVLLDAHRYDLSRKFQSLVSQSNGNRVTFYTFDAGGLRTYSYMDASNQGPGGGAQIDQIHFSNLQSPLLYMAAETGGMAVINTNNFLPGLEKMAGDFDTYYSLGFTPGSEESGRYHRIKVELKEKRKGIRIRHREGYRDKPISTRMADGALAALHYGYQRNELGVQLDAGLGKRQDNGQFLVPFVVRIPIGELSFLPANEMKRARVKLFIAARDTEGGIADVQEVPVPIDIPADAWDRAKEQFYHYQVTLLMRPGRQMVVVGVRDEIGATAGFVTRGLDVGKG
ncbi:MAG: VWA domain-containing protein, partial [Holophagales bacterium]|nr:VWA domain-containing protein [Holophagales bacterium]